MTLQAFKQHIIDRDPRDLANELMKKPTVLALADAAAYEAFRQKIRASLQACESIYVVGSGNWGFSLNPDKIWRPFHPKSDIDVVIVSRQLYFDTWAMIRAAHREKWYLLASDERQNLLRYGQNIYAGFVSPLWAPRLRYEEIYKFKSMLNRLSGPEVGHREVKMIYFRNEIEAVDYYRRSFANAQRALRNEVRR